MWFKISQNKPRMKYYLYAGMTLPVSCEVSEETDSYLKLYFPSLDEVRTMLKPQIYNLLFDTYEEALQALAKKHNKDKESYLKSFMGSFPRHAFFSYNKYKTYGFYSYFNPAGRITDITDAVTLSKNSLKYQFVPKDAVYVGVVVGDVVFNSLENRYFKRIPQINGRPIDELFKTQGETQ